MYSQDASIAEIQRWLLSERIKVNYSTVYRFIKHLCGGESSGSMANIPDYFLSHLCGGE
jgi:hypothetical protein